MWGGARLFVDHKVYQIFYLKKKKKKKKKKKGEERKRKIITEGGGTRTVGEEREGNAQK